MANPQVYIETSVISYLTALESRDRVLAAHQQVTREWWSRRQRFELFVSDAVIEEAGRGDSEAAARRLAALAGISVLSATEPAQALANALLRAAAMPSKAAIDAAHVAIAATHGVEFLMTWNCTHIANAVVRGKIEAVCRQAGFRPPVICTPLELRLEEDS